MVIRKAHLTGLRPIVTVTFEGPVNTVRKKPEQLQIQMKAAPYRLQGIWLLLYFSAKKQWFPGQVIAGTTASQTQILLSDT